MQIIFGVVKLAVVLMGGFLLTTRVIPWVFVHGMRRLGFSMKMTPITQKRVARFQRIKRGYYSFLLISTLFVTSLFLELIVNSKPLAICYDGRIAFPAVKEWAGNVLFFAKISSFYKKDDFGQLGKSEVDYRQFARYSSDPAQFRAAVEELKQGMATDREKLVQPAADAKPHLKQRYERALEKLRKRGEEIARLETNLEVFEKGRAWCVMPVYPYAPSDLRHDLKNRPPNKPSLEEGIPLGTDLSGRDVVPLMLYGFRISLVFALIITLIGYAVGIVVGGIQGYYGGWMDIATQRIVEIWSAIPFLFVIMIIVSLVQPSFMLLVVLMVILVSWIGITYYVRGEFYREKAKDYVQAAIGSGVSDWKIITRHILPNALVPIVTFGPFRIVGYISSLVALDYLGFGLPPGTPSWGALLRQGLEDVRSYPHLTIVPTAALALTLYAVVLIGEAVREAFDPKVFSRLR